MIWSGFNHECFQAFPELEEGATQTFSYFDEEEPGTFLIFEDILRPVIEQAACDGEIDRLTDLMNFLESFADRDYDCLIQIGLGETLINSDVRRIIYDAAGPLTKRELDIAMRIHIKHVRDRESRPLLEFFRNAFSKSEKKG